MFDLTGKTALVTGASGGIGGAIARACTRRAPHVALSGTRAAALEDSRPSSASAPMWSPRNLDDAADIDAPGQGRPRRRWASSTSW